MKPLRKREKKGAVQTVLRKILLEGKKLEENSKREKDLSTPDRMVSAKTRGGKN